MKDVTHYRYGEHELDLLMTKRGFDRVDHCFTNFHVIFHPFDNLIPSIYIHTSEAIDRNRLGTKYKHWGSNYIALYRNVR